MVSIGGALFALACAWWIFSRTWAFVSRVACAAMSRTLAPLQAGKSPPRTPSAPNTGLRPSPVWRPVFRCEPRCDISASDLGDDVEVATGEIADWAVAVPPFQARDEHPDSIGVVRIVRLRHQVDHCSRRRLGNDLLTRSPVRIVETLAGNTDVVSVIPSRPRNCVWISSLPQRTCYCFFEIAR